MGIYTKGLRKYTNGFSQYTLPCLPAELCTRISLNIKLKNCQLEHNVRLNGIWHKQFKEKEKHRNVRDRIYMMISDLTMAMMPQRPDTKYLPEQGTFFFLHSPENLRDTPWRSWLRHCATSRKVAGPIPVDVIGISHWHNPSGRTMTLGMTQPLTEMSARNISLGIKAAGA